MCFVINITLEIHWEKIISWKTTYKVAWLSLTYYLKPKAMPLSIKKNVQKISLHIPFILPVCISEILWEVLLYPFDLFSVCIFFWLWQCFGLHTMSWQTEHFLIQKRNHYWFFRFFRVPEFLVFLPPHLLHWLSDFSGLSAVSCYVRNKSILLIVFRIFFLMTCYCIRMETEWNSVCPLLTCQMCHVLEHIMSFS